MNGLDLTCFCWLTRRRNARKTSPSVSFEWALTNLAVVSDKSFCLRVALKAKVPAKDIPDIVLDNNYTLLRRGWHLRQRSYY